MGLGLVLGPDSACPKCDFGIYVGIRMELWGVVNLGVAKVGGV